LRFVRAELLQNAKSLFSRSDKAIYNNLKAEGIFSGLGKDCLPSVSCLKIGIMIPSGSSIFDVQVDWVGDWAGKLPLRPWVDVPFGEAVRDLQLANIELWTLEDRCRAAQGDLEMGRLKREVDGHKLRRVQLVNQIDGLLVAREGLPTAVPAPDPLWNSETPGALIDRLSILALKLHHGSQLDGDAVGEMLEGVSRHAGFLCARLDHLLRGLDQGELRFYPSRHVRIYNHLQAC
jgi:hypothetical protein